MGKIEYRAVIKFFVKECLPSNKIHSKFINVYGDSSPSFSTVKKRAAEFKRGRTGPEDDPRKGRTLVHSMMFGQRRNRLTTHFSERIPVIERRMSLFPYTALTD
jgi:hypothetical protein